MPAKKVLAGTAVFATVLAAGVVAVPGVAEASAGSGCSYPYVCLYAGSGMTHPTGRFRDVTSGWQYLGRSFGDRGFRNTRHDDVAYVKTTSGRTICLRPGTSGGLFSGGATAIRISYRSSC
jgi:hypothetical protein